MNEHLSHVSQFCEICFEKKTIPYLDFTEVNTRSLSRSYNLKSNYIIVN